MQDLMRAGAIVACATLAFGISGCATAPFLPEGGVPEAVPGYGVKDIADEKCQDSGENELACARNRLRAQFDDYAESRQHIQQYRNVMNLGLFGIAGAAGVNAVTKGSKSGLQTLGLVAAGLVGLDDVLKVDNQHETFGAGVEALQCVMDMDLSFDDLRRQFTQGAATMNETDEGFVPYPDGDSAAMARRNGTSTRLSASQLERIALQPYANAGPHMTAASRTTATGIEGRKPLAAQLSASVSTSQMALRDTIEVNYTMPIAAAISRRGGSTDRGNRTAQEAFGHDSAGGSGSTALLADARDRQIAALNQAAETVRETIRLRSQTAKLSDAARAHEMHAALTAIRKAVSDRLLFSHKDLSGIYQALKDAMQKAVKPPQTSPTGTPTNGGATPSEVKATVAAAVTSRRDVTAELQTFQEMVELAQQDVKDAEPYTNTFDDCMKKAIKATTGETPPASRNGGDRNGGNGGTS